MHHAIAASEPHAQHYIQSQIQLAAPSDSTDKALKSVIKRQQAASDKMDPAWKSLSFTGWGQRAASERIDSSKVFLSELFPDIAYNEIRTFTKGKEELPITLVEFYSRADKEQVLKWCMDEKNPKLLGGAEEQSGWDTPKQPSS